MLLDNKNSGSVGKELRVRSFEGSRLSVLSGLFTIYGFAALKKELSKVVQHPTFFDELAKSKSPMLDWIRVRTSAG